jgi:hypothetical protein
LYAQTLRHSEATCQEIAKLSVTSEAISGNSAEWVQFWNAFQERIEQLQNNSAVLSSISSEMRGKFVQHIDVMEDDIAIALQQIIEGEGELRLGEIVWERTSTIISTLATTHVTWK